MPELSDHVIRLFRYKRAMVEGQGGLLTGINPTTFDKADPLRIWIIQIGVIIIMSQLLSLVLRRIRQPRVIAEVLGGILLGPTAFGRIPGFTNHIFPEKSLPYLSLTANIGLCLFLFLVGLEIDTGIIKRNARLSFIIAFAGMALPFGFGSALSVPLYHHFISPSVKFTNFMLFTGVAYSITAFPVLCRILTELKLLDTTVGIVVLSAGVGNDIVGWTLLALSIALVNGGAGVTAVYILLTCLAWALFLLFFVKRVFVWLARKTGSTENGPTMFFMTFTILFTFASAFFTDVIGVQAIFGAFLVGIIVPREGGLAIALTEKLEDMVSILFLPLYFTLSGLNTNLGLLNDGITWGFTIAIMTLAFTGKFGGCSISARLAGFPWREATTIGSLMSCKGLVELIVLNAGLSAGILTQKVFSMFVFEALVLTFMTTPLVTILYPPERRTRVVAHGAYASVAPHADRDKKESGSQRRLGARSSKDDGWIWKTRFTVVIDKLEHLPGMMCLAQLIQPPVVEVPGSDDSKHSTHSEVSYSPSPPLEHLSDASIDALRLIELSDRTSAVMKSSAADTLLITDPLLGIFRTFSELHDMKVSSSLSVVTFGDLAARLVEHAYNNDSDLILLPWLPPRVSSSESHEPTTPKLSADNPFDMLFDSLPAETTASATQSQFVRAVFSQAKTDVALFMDRGYALGEGRTAWSRYHIFLPFFGGPDDRAALDFVVQLCANPRINASVVRVTKKDIEHSLVRPDEAHLTDRQVGDMSVDHDLDIRSTIVSGGAFSDTIYGNVTTQTRMQSQTADNVAWFRYASYTHEGTGGDTLTAALSRVQFSELSTPTPLHAVVKSASSQLGSLIERRERLLVLTGRSRRLAVEDHDRELRTLMEEHTTVGPEVRKTIGDVATALLVSGCNAGVVIVQATNTPSSA